MITKIFIDQHEYNGALRIKEYALSYEKADSALYLVGVYNEWMHKPYTKTYVTIFTDKFVYETLRIDINAHFVAYTYLKDYLRKLLFYGLKLGNISLDQLFEIFSDLELFTPKIQYLA